MEKLVSIVMIILAMFTSSCNSKNDSKTTSKNDDQIAQEASIEYIKQQLINPVSFKVISVEVKLDTIPPYLSEHVLESYNQFSMAKEEANDFIPDYSSRADLQKRINLLADVIDKGKSLQNIIKDSRNTTPDVQYLTCIKYSASNAFGESISSYSIVVASKEKPDSVLGSYDMEDEGFMTRFQSLSQEFYGEEKFKHNKYGKIDTTGFPFFEKFIINSMQ